jgi:hypothetical protein
MARKVKEAGAIQDFMSLDQRNALIKTMLELAHRGPHETSLMVRCANAGGLKEVTDHVKSMRLMFKRFTGGREPRTPAPVPTPRKKSKKRKSTALRAEDGII